MKFYVHYEIEPEMTIACRWRDSDEGSVGDVLKLFLDAYNKRYPSHALNASTLQLVDESRQFLDLDLSVEDAIQDGADIYVLTKLPSKSTEPVAATAASLVEDKTANSKSSLLDILRSAQLTGGFELPISVRDGSTYDDHLLIANAIQLAHKYLVDENAKEAAVVYKCILEVHPGHKSACIELGQLYARASRYQEAVKYLKQALASYSGDEELLKILGDYLVENGDYLEAVDVYAACVDKLKNAGPDKIDDIKVRITRAKRLEGHESAALTLISSVLQRKKENEEGLLEYARLVHTKGPEQATEAMAICMCLAAPMQHNKKYHMFLADVVRRHGVGLLYAEMKTAADSPAALAYLATQIRDYGAVEEAATVMKRALDIEPSHVSCALAYIHTLQVLVKYDEAYEFIRQFTVTNGGQSVAGVKCSWFLPLIPKLDTLYMNSVIANEGKIPDEFSSCSSSTGGPYSTAELQLVAIYFTLVKILFFRGAVELLKPLCKLLDSAHSGRDLHTTLIRNESAYFSCISQVVKVPGMHVPAGVAEKTEFIYFAGESHTISPAWRSITYQGRPHVIHPILATGLKVWHLRPESRFYPKVAFYNAMGKVPQGSTVIFCFGEIDCREGLTTAVQKCKYETLEESVMAVINVYVAALKKLMKKHKFKVFIHPVVPVLAVTRKVVSLFNKMLKERLAKSKRLRYLDFSDALLTEDGLKLNPQYELDGSHLHPSYLSVIEDALKG